MESFKPDTDRQESPKTVKLPTPLPVARAVQKLGGDMGLARRRRHISQQSLAERIGASVSTVKRMEQGDLRVPIHFFVRALYVFGEIERLANLMDTAEDAVGLTLMDEQIPKRIRARKANPDGGAL